MSNFSELFRKHCIIAINNKLIDPKGFNLREVPNRSYKIFDPVSTEEGRQLYLLVDLDTDVIYEHMLCVRSQAYDVIGEEYLFIRGYQVGHTLEGEAVIVVVDTQVKGGCHVFDDNGHIGGDGVGRWHAFYALRALNLSWLMTLKPKKRGGGYSSRERISSDAKTRTRSIHRSFNRPLFYRDETLCTVPLLGDLQEVMAALTGLRIGFEDHPIPDPFTLRLRLTFWIIKDEQAILRRQTEVH